MSVNEEQLNIENLAELAKINLSKGLDYFNDYAQKKFIRS